MSDGAEILHAEIAAAQNPDDVPPAEHWPDDDRPLIIERRPGWHALDTRELWTYRDLLYFLAWRDIKVRYKQTVLGAAWALLQPLAIMLIFSLFLGRAMPTKGTDVAYPLFVLAALLPWTFFSSAIGTAGQSVVVNQSLVTKVYFPRMIIPMGALAAAFIDFAISIALLLVMMMIYHVWPNWHVLLAPLIVGGLVIAAMGVGSLLAALTVAYRDFRHAIPFMIQLWMFATPNIYLRPEQIVSARWRSWLALNPAYGLIENFRAAALGMPMDFRSLSISVGVSFALLLAGSLYFRRVERSFADVI